MKSRTNILIIFLFSLICFHACKKDISDPSGGTSNAASMLPGIWKVKHLILEQFDGSGNIVKTDTLQFTDIAANPIKVSESYTANNYFYLMSEDYSDTLNRGTYSLIGNRINLQLLDTNYSFKSRTIVNIDNQNMTVFQKFDDVNPKVKLTQVYIR